MIWGTAFQAEETQAQRVWDENKLHVPKTEEHHRAWWGSRGGAEGS